ncbi:MAG: hypothetical protein LBS04_01145 [Tannerellaceae bacterium]|nr:hypothetical protein [Tannerellaceae bacterium]
MKKLIILLALLSAAFTSYTQNSNEKRSAFHFSFVPPVSTNGINAAQYTNTASFSLLVGLAKNEEIFGFAGLANIVMNNADGFQFAGLANYVGNEYRGLQFAGLSNYTGDMTGLQFAGLGNIASNVKGLQFGGLFNVAKNVSGVQFAGLVNLAENSDYPIALLNIIKNGEYGIAATYNEIGSVTLTFRSGGRITYGILGVGYNHKADDEGFVVEGGFGAHINITDWLRLNNEIKGGTIGDLSDDDTFYFNYALLPAFRPVRNIEIFGGPSINYMQSDNLKNKDMFPNHSIWKKYSDTQLKQVYIGYQVGIQVLF